MGANSSKILYVDTQDIQSFPVYGTEDLNFFEGLLNDIRNDHEPFGSLAPNKREYLRSRLAAAIFRSADAGERDYARLKRSAIEAIEVPS